MKELVRRFRMILTYFSHSVLSTVVDTAIVWILLRYEKVDITWANTAGVVAGFILGFFLDVKRTFRTRYSLPAFAVYFGTFLLGLVLANVLITATYNAAIGFLPQAWAFLIGKGVSVAVPFFAMYLVRKIAYQALDQRGRRDG